MFSERLTAIITHVEKIGKSIPTSRKDILALLEKCSQGGILELDETILREIMVPRTAMVCADDAQDAADVARLASRHDRCILLASAQYAIPTLAGE